MFELETDLLLLIINEAVSIAKVSSPAVPFKISESVPPNPSTTKLICPVPVKNKINPSSPIPPVNATGITLARVLFNVMELLNWMPWTVIWALALLTVTIPLTTTSFPDAVTERMVNGEVKPSIVRTSV